MCRGKAVAFPKLLNLQFSHLNNIPTSGYNNVSVAIVGPLLHATQHDRHKSVTGATIFSIGL